MLFVFTGQDRPGCLELRKATRPAHLDYWKQFGPALRFGGPLLDDLGNPKGSILIFEARDRRQAEDMSSADPYATAGLFATASLDLFRLVFRDGEMVG
ncbi:MAG TPA: YciI family protein [Acetobacteraceae bacterium]|nr:YciI family protein [Acetobacteraceae bacterium]